MEYVFGTDKGKEILKTKGSRHSSLIVGEFYEHIAEYPDQTVTDRYRITGKYDSKEDEEGNCYDWYSIDKHYRTQDFFSPAKPGIDNNFADVENATIELSEDIDSRLADIENALCELSEG